MNSGNKILVNTVILYGRMLLSVGITLYTTRLVLNGLGVIDYGIYNLVAGVVFMLSFLNSAMTTSTQRFLSYYLGKNDLKIQQSIFSNSLKLHIFIGLVIIFVLEVAGFFLFRGFLNIPLNRLSAAKFVYHLMSLTVFFTITVAPFNALLISHENMLMVAMGNLIQNILQLGAAFFLIHYTSDKLEFYGLSTELISFITFCAFWGICYAKYEECHSFFKQKIHRKLMKEIASNVSWNLLGVLSGIAKNQGVAVVFNVFDGPITNTAYAIASQVSGQLNFFSGAMLRAINPQLMRSEGEGNRERMLKLSFFACKIGFFLLAIVAIPAMFYMPEILTVWLKKVPPFSVDFCRWVLVAFMANQLTMGLDSAIQATGTIKKYMIWIGFFKILLIPIAVILLFLKLDVRFVLVSYCLTEFAGSIVRIAIVSKMFNHSLLEIVKSRFVPVLLSVVIASLLIYFLDQFLRYHAFNFIIAMILYAFVYTLSFIFIGLDKNERSNMYFTISSLFKKKLLLNKGEGKDLDLSQR